MSLDSIPPWISVSPAQFGNAAAEGAHLDLARQQLETESAMNAARLSIQKQQQDRQFALQQEQTGFEQEMKQTQLQMATQQVARKYAAQQQYQSLVNSGVEPAQAMLKVGPSLGINMVGAGQLARWGAPPPPPQSIDMGNGRGGVYYNRRYYPNKPTQPEFTDETIDGNMYQRDSQGKLYPVAHSGGMSAPGALTPQQKARIGVLQNQAKMYSSDPLVAIGKNPAGAAKLKAINDELDQLTGGQAAATDDGSEDASDDGSTPSPTAAPIAQAQAPIQMVWNPDKKRYMMPSQQ